jgi:hypothetical protein
MATVGSLCSSCPSEEICSADPGGLADCIAGRDGSLPLKQSLRHFASTHGNRRARLSVVVRDISIEPGELPVPPVGPEPERVYHYAGVTGFKGIIAGQCLWASDVWYMNDSREALYGFRAIERALQAMTPGTGLESDVRQAALDRLTTWETKMISCIRTSPV